MMNVQMDVYGNVKRTLQAHPYPLLFATGTGSRAFGCASVSSDLDVHGVHLLPLNHILGLNAQSHDTIERKEPVSALHPALEIATHDLKKFIMLLLKGNGNVLEDLYSPMVIITSPVHKQLQTLAQGCITRKCALHYRGMAFNQQRNLRSNEVKKLIHMYRCLLMGIHLMNTHTIEMHLPTLAKYYNYAQIDDLIERKVSGTQSALSDEALNRHLATFEMLQLYLERAANESTLPEQPTPETREALEQLLIETRMGAQ